MFWKRNDPIRVELINAPTIIAESKPAANERARAPEKNPSIKFLTWDQFFKLRARKQFCLSPRQASSGTITDRALDNVSVPALFNQPNGGIPALLRIAWGDHRNHGGDVQKTYLSATQVLIFFQSI